MCTIANMVNMVSTHSRPKAAVFINTSYSNGIQFQHTAARRRLQRICLNLDSFGCFNTQPPEGGWRKRYAIRTYRDSFNTQPPEGG